MVVVFLGTPKKGRKKVCICMHMCVCAFWVRMCASPLGGQKLAKSAQTTQIWPGRGPGPLKVGQRWSTEGQNRFQWLRKPKTLKTWTLFTHLDHFLAILAIHPQRSVKNWHTFVNNSAWTGSFESKHQKMFQTKSSMWNF